VYTHPLRTLLEERKKERKKERNKVLNINKNIFLVSSPTRLMP